MRRKNYKISVTPVKSGNQGAKLRLFFHTTTLHTANIFAKSRVLPLQGLNHPKNPLLVIGLYVAPFFFLKNVGDSQEYAGFLNISECVVDGGAKHLHSG